MEPCSGVPCEFGAIFSVVELPSFYSHGLNSDSPIPTFVISALPLYLLYPKGKIYSLQQGQHGFPSHILLASGINL